MKPFISSFLLLLALQNSDPAVATYRIPGMEISISWNTTGDLLLIEGKANTTGWVCVGFNNQEGIVGADLKMLALQGKELLHSDRKTLDFGDYPEDTALGGSNGIMEAKGSITHETFHFSFSIDPATTETFDQNLMVDEALWIILAYSEDSDFKHHSEIRKQLRFKLPQ